MVCEHCWRPMRYIPEDRWWRCDCCETAVPADEVDNRLVFADLVNAGQLTLFDLAPYRRWEH